MAESKLKQFLSSLDREQYELVVGTTTNDPLTAAFPKRRVVHAGVNGKGIRPDQWQQQWQELVATPAPAAPRVAYIHIPFCRHRCLYCGFFQNYSHEEQETAYVDQLIAELELTNTQPYITSRPINAVFFGGGTPSTLEPHNITRLLRAVKEYLPLANDCELTLEGRISDLTPAKIEAWVAGGVNRVSIGVQSFNTAVRQSVGRIDDTDTILNRLQLLSSYNQTAVIIDLIYGLPGQTPAIWEQDLALLKQAAIDGWDLYQLNLFEQGPLQQAIAAGKLPPAATTVEQAQMFATAERDLAADVFTRLSICHWSKSSRERSIYNTLTKAGYSVLPFGAGAGGNMGELRMFLQRDVKLYAQAVAAGNKPFLGLGLQAPDHKLYSQIVRQLEHCYIDLAEVAALYGSDVLALQELLQIWEANGLLVIGEKVAKLTVAGQFWSKNLTQSLLEGLDAVLNEGHEIAVQPIAAQG